MPPKKRKATASGASTPAKKVRIGDTSDVPEVTSTGRPKRSSVGEPQYSLTRKRAPKPATEESPGKALSISVEPKKRGRPPKVIPQPPNARKQTATRQPHPVRGGTTAVSTSFQAATKKPRGRPPSAAPTVAKKRGTPSTKKTTTTPSASEAKVTNTQADTEQVDEATTGEDNGFVDGDIQYWLMKAEPESRIEKGHDVKFSIDDLASKAEPEGWDGVRNAAARNHMRAMRKGDLAFFYHSNCAVPGVAGVMRIVEEHQVDPSAFDPDHPYYDAKSDRDNPKWEMVKVEFVKKFDGLVTLRELKSFSDSALAGMSMLKQGRLSVSPVTAAEWQFILDLAGEKASLGQPTLEGGYETDIDSAGTDGVNDDVDGENTLPKGTGDDSGLNAISKAHIDEWESADDAVVPQSLTNGMLDRSD
ncbi:hypothetical protein LTR84_000157 [Exophiala bonariae]|uniref:Thymocyte nuclear protein 1 n=1 Tax=Exophiala bonariae TaxID=1690606 RepID=A0AAV9NRJ2_9EURO|nr:hypothetical protein LTR84_000157 [Exophiala bonariae]